MPGTWATLIANTKNLLAAMAGNPLLVRKTGTTEAESELVSIQETSNNALPVEMVAAGVLPTGAATEAKQDIGNASLSSIDGKITACNTGAVTVAASALPTGAATEATLTAIGCPTQRLAATTTLASDPHDWTAAPASGGILVDTDGVYKLTLSGDDVGDFILPKLLAGVHYPYSVSRIWATGSPAGAKVTPFKARA